MAEGEGIGRNCTASQMPHDGKGIGASTLVGPDRELAGIGSAAWRWCDCRRPEEVLG